MPIRLFAEGIDFKLSHPQKTIHWIKRVIEIEKAFLGDISYIFCTDTHLHKLNQEYLGHNTLTDILTFDFCEEEDKRVISGDIYISIERVVENAKKFARPFDEELHRVIIHGILHLLKYSDKTVAAKALMRKKEEACLSLRK